MNYRAYALQILSSHFKKILKHQQGVRKQDGIEDLHQLRVYSRRMRNAMWVFQNIFTAAQYQHWDKKIRKITRATGKARDLDVYMEFLKDMRKKTRPSDVQEGLDEFSEFLKDKRAQKQQKVMETLDHLQDQGVFKDIQKFLDGLKTRHNKKGERRRIASTAQQRIRRRIRQLLAMKAYVYHPDKVNELHRLRIGAKHLRYTMECFQDFYGTSMAKYINAVIPLQRVLGHLHDYDVWLTHIPVCLDEKKDNRAVFHSMVYLEKRLQSLRAKVYKQLVVLWKKYEDKKFWKTFEQYLTKEAA